MRLLYWLTNEPWPQKRSHIVSMIVNVNKVKLVAEDGNGAIEIEQGDGCFIIRSDKVIENVVPEQAEVH